jgi:hypothetical protein
MKQYGELDSVEQDRDRETIRKYPEIPKRAGYWIVPMPAKSRIG